MQNLSKFIKIFGNSVGTIKENGISKNDQREHPCCLIGLMFEPLAKIL